MRIALAQLNYHIGNFDSNVAKIKEGIRKAKKLDADLVVFAELAICGYPPRDFLEFESFIQLCENGIRDIAAECNGIAAIVGAPARNPGPKGKRLFNAAYFIENGAVKQVVHKTLLPNYDVFDEYRYFEPNNSFRTITCGGKKIALTICEDIWNVNTSGLYPQSPMEYLVKEEPELIINIAASPFSFDHFEQRLSILQKNATLYGLPVFYVNHVGAQTELIFDGGSMVLNGKGQTVAALDTFREELGIFDTEKLEATSTLPVSDKMERIRKALVLGIDNYFGKLGFKKAIIGLSGGIDSALTLVLACEALGRENVLAVLMPSQFSSAHSVDDSVQLCRKLGCDYQKLPISNVYDTYLKLLAPHFEGKPFDVTEENIQARIRANLLMALSNKLGHILLNTSNKSELAVGYGTLYGDMCGGLSVLGDLYKTEVYELARYINRNDEIIPVNIIEKPASAELRPDQKDTDSLPPYEILDPVLRLYIEETLSPEAIITKGFDEQLVKKVLKLVNISEYKRFQAPPVLRVSGKAFGMGRRMPIVGKYLS